MSSQYYLRLLRHALSLVCSKLLRKVGRCDMARLSIRNAVQSGLNEEEALIQVSPCRR